jgi:hypothetical protein
MGVCDRRDGGVVAADPGDGEEGGEESGFFLAGHESPGEVKGRAPAWICCLPWIDGVDDGQMRRRGSESTAQATG